jgi:thymidylate kinase
MENSDTMKPRLNRAGKVARVVAFSGVDCSGKSTQISVLIEKLRQRGEKPFYIRLRIGYTPLFCALKNALRRLLGQRIIPQGPSPQRDRSLSSGWKRGLWLHLAFADMAFETAVRIRVLRLLGHKVVCDRYIEDSEMDLIMYFGERTAQLPAWKVVKAIAVTPDVRILLDLPFEEALRRSILKNEPFPDPEETRRRRAGHYEKLKQQSDYCIVDARMSIAEISAVICSLVIGEDSPAKTSTEALP